MRIIQMLPVLSFGDAVGNNTIALKKALQKEGFQTEIYADYIDNRLPMGTAKSINSLKKVNEDDVILYHFSTGHPMNKMLERYNCHKIMQYHNVTPPRFFKDYNLDAYLSCKQGLEDLKNIKDQFEYVLADSEFNKKDLQEYGYNCSIDIMPILIPFEDYKKTPAENIVKKYKDGYVNILFTGRIVPNKKHEDLIEAFYYYKKYVNKKSRLILVGTTAGVDSYYNKLKKFVEELELEDVVFTGHIKFNEILAYYTVADIFLCMSEHEGFCVPLIEAMCFDLPVVARNTSAIGDTLGGASVLLEDNDPLITAKMIEYVMNDEDLRKQIIHNQRVRLKDFQSDVITKRFISYIKNYMETLKK